MHDPSQDKKLDFGFNNTYAVAVPKALAELEDTYTVVRDNAPDCLLVGNIGAPQLNLAEKAIGILDADMRYHHSGR